MLPLFPLLIFILIIAGLVMQRKTAKRVDRLEKEIKALQARITGMSLPQPAEAAIAEPVTAVETITENLPPAETPDTPAAPQLAARTAETEQVAVPDNAAPEHAITAPITDIAATQPPEERESFESWLGARWAVWVGGVALAFGGLFLVKYTIEAGLLGPAARLSLAALFGIVLMAGGELIRRRAMPDLSDRFGNAMIPGALTAAGAVTLMGAIFAAYAVYEFIGPTPAFLALALVSFATIALSLLHGQALAGLGLLASLATPALVSTENPSANALFGFLALVWLAVNAASRFRQWTVVPTLANVGLGLWTIAYLDLSETDMTVLPPTLTLLVMIAGSALLWPGRYFGIIGPERPGISMLLSRPPLQITLSLALICALSALLLQHARPQGSLEAQLAFSAVIAAMAALGASRIYAVWPVIIAAIATLLGMAWFVSINFGYGFLYSMTSIPLDIIGARQPIAEVGALEQINRLFLGLAALFPLLGFAFLKRFRTSEPDFSKVWAFLMPAVPVAIATISFFNFGNLNRDWTHGLYGLGLGIVLLAGADWLFRKGDSEDRIDWPANLLVAGSFAGFTLALHTLTNGIVTTIALSVLGFLYVLGLRIRPWPSLPWMMAAAMLIVFGRIAWEPTVIGANSLGTTPFFNALLPGYGIPTLFAVISAWMLRNSADLRIRNIMQALASLAALITVAVLVRHAMNGGTLEATVPTLGEQSIYTLITVGFSGILMMLDLKSPSPVFRYGSMIAGVAATANVLSLHLFGLNPYFTGEGTGPWPFLNLLLLGYLMPALAYALVAWLARERRPMPYVAMLAISGGVLGFVWATLSVRRFWQGENIADWKGFMAAETYTYSVVWLLLGILLLILGSRFNQRSLRLASAALVLVAVLKVFLIDMSNLEGILRALSFMGLGAVLIGIGLFYQRILVKKDGKKRPVDSAGMPEGNAP